MQLSILHSAKASITDGHSQRFGILYFTVDLQFTFAENV